MKYQFIQKHGNKINWSGSFKLNDIINFRIVYKLISKNICFDF